VILLDTDIAVDLLRAYGPAVAWLSSQANEEIFLPGYVVMELIQGCFNKRELTKVRDFVKPFPLLWPSPDVSDDALEIYSQGRLSHNLGLLDALIGQLAVSLDAPLHTFNQKHFVAIRDLKTIQPYAK
jgi:tRNA(fMet)-specific endonuclease VapC